MWIIYAVTASIFWGLNYALDEKILHNKISAATLLFLQMITGAFVFFIVLIFNKNFQSDFQILINSRSLFVITLTSIIVTLFANLFIILSIQAQNATVTTLIELSYPLITILFTWILFKESHLNTSMIIGGLFILTGSIITILFSN